MIGYLLSAHFLAGVVIDHDLCAVGISEMILCKAPFISQLYRVELILAVFVYIGDVAAAVIHDQRRHS